MPVHTPGAHPAAKAEREANRGRTPAQALAEISVLLERRAAQEPLGAAVMHELAALRVPVYQRDDLPPGAMVFQRTVRTIDFRPSPRRPTQIVLAESIGTVRERNVLVLIGEARLSEVRGRPPRPSRRSR